MTGTWGRVGEEWGGQDPPTGCTPRPTAGTTRSQSPTGHGRSHAGPRTGRGALGWASASLGRPTLTGGSEASLEAHHHGRVLAAGRPRNLRGPPRPGESIWHLHYLQGGLC